MADARRPPRPRSQYAEAYERDRLSRPRSQYAESYERDWLPRPRSPYAEILERDRLTYRRRLVRVIIAWLCAIVLFLLIVGAIVVFITWLALRPHKPRYSVDYGSISSFNVTQRTLDTRMTFNVTSRNPNERIGIIYDKMEAYAYYGYQRIAGAYIAPFYQGHKNTTVIRPILTAHHAALKEDISKELQVERSSRSLELTLKLYGRVRFKVGSWKSHHYNMKVQCHVTVDRRKGASGSFPSKACSVYF